MAKRKRPPTQHRIISIRLCANKKHIAKIRFTDPTGREVTTWTVDRAAKAIKAGTDEFLVATTVWSPVDVYRKGDQRYLRTVKDSCDHSNLYSLPEF